MKIISKEESEELIRRYMSQAEDYNFAIAPTGIPCFLVKNSSAIIANDDGSVTWFAREISICMHSFIELRTGEEKTKTIYIPLCLVNPTARQFAEVLINTTKSPLDGRFGSKKAEAIIFTPDGKGVAVCFELKGLPIHHVTLQLFPQDHASKFKSSHCPFCRMVDSTQPNGGV
jgi:hypothetical protein